jgi:hypothetical protein
MPTGMTSMGRSNRGGAGGPPSGGPMLAGPKGGQMAAPGTTPEDPAKKKARHTRTEFVITLVWREPTPSDALIEDATEEAPVSGGFGGGKGGLMSGFKLNNR